MADEKHGLTTKDTTYFAVRIGDGRWREIEGITSFVDGLCHKIEFPGFVTRSGGSFGITATFHTVEREWQDGAQKRGDIARWVMVNGLLQTVETIERDVELVN